jgi:hypothetical protein
LLRASRARRLISLGSDVRAADVDVREQPPVAVALLDVELEPHVAVADEALVEVACAIGVALARSVGLGRLGRVDADVPHALDPPGVEPHADRVTVRHRHDAAVQPPRRARLPLVAACREGGGRQRGRRRRAQRQTRASDSASS